MKYNIRNLMMSVIAAIVIIGIAPGNTHAITLKGLLEGESVVAGDMIFGNWTGVTEYWAYDLIEVTPFEDNLSIGLEYNFNGQIDVIGTGSKRLMFSYDVIPTDSHRLVGNELMLGDYEFNDIGGSIAIVQGTTVDGSTEYLDDVYVDNLHGTMQDFSSSVYDQQMQSLISVMTIIDVYGNDTRVSLGTFSQTFVQTQLAPVPEPTTMLLLGTGLIGLAGFRRKFRKS